MARRKVAAKKKATARAKAKAKPPLRKKTARKKAAAKAPARAKPAVAPPFALEIEIAPPASGDEGPRFLTMVRNVAKTGKRILVDYQVQPVILLLSRDGVVLAPFDERTRKKFDLSRHTWLFRVMGPGSGYVVEEDVFRREDGAWSLHYGSFTFSNLEPGRYVARARFTSAGQEWQDGEKHGRYDDLWEGTVDSPPVEFLLP